MEFREGINFALSADGIMFLVNDYELFPIGNCDFTPMVYSEKNEYGRLFEIMGYFIPFSEAEGMFSEKYL